MKNTVEELARHWRKDFTPLDPTFSCYSAYPIAEEDLRQYLQEPISALPDAIRELLPKIQIALVPYLQKSSGRTGPSVVDEKPAEAKLLLSSQVFSDGAATLFFTVKDEQVSDYHYYFFESLAYLVAERLPEKVQNAYHRVMREELSAEVHGEVDEQSWRLKQALLRRPTMARKDSKPFRDYARQSFVDTLTLYLHGICCDIDVETGPRQLPSRYLRKRLVAFKEFFPAPEGFAVFPEDLNRD